MLKLGAGTSILTFLSFWYALLSKQNKVTLTTELLVSVHAYALFIIFKNMLLDLE